MSVAAAIKSCGDQPKKWIIVDRSGKIFENSRETDHHHLGDGFDAVVVGELQPLEASFFPQLQQDVQEVTTLPQPLPRLLLVFGHDLRQKLVPGLVHVVDLLLEPRRAPEHPCRRVRQQVVRLEPGHQRRGVRQELPQPLGRRPGGPGRGAGDHRVGVAVQELLQLHGLSGLGGSPGPRHQRRRLCLPHGRERIHAALGEEVHHRDLLGPAPVVPVRREGDVAGAVRLLVSQRVVRAGGEGEVVVPEQVRRRRGRGHDQGPPAPQLQEEESPVAAIAEVQLVQGPVREAADEMEVTDQRQRRGRRRELAPAPPVLDDVEETEKQGSAGDGEHESRHLLFTLPATEAEPLR